MGIETFGAECPNCKAKAVFSKIEPNSIGGFEFDACPSCGFIEFITSEICSRAETTRECRMNTWLSILSHYSVLKVEDLPRDTPCLDAQLAFEYEAQDPYLKECIIPLDEINRVALEAIGNVEPKGTDTESLISKDLPL